jgi:hypothetical protein
VVAGLQLMTALLLFIGIWATLPTRWWPVDVAGTALGCVLAAGGVALLVVPRWGRRISLAAGWLTLIAGCGAVSALFMTLSHLSGLYGPIGAGGALLMGAVAALVLPYLVALPVLQLILLRNLDR